MRCPTCRVENVPGAPACTACGQALNESAAAVHVRVSRVAIASSICAITAAVCLLPSFIAQFDPRVLHPHSGLVAFCEAVTFFGTGAGFLLGVAGLLSITTTGGRLTGYPFAMLGAAAPFFFLLGLFYIPTFGFVKFGAFRIVCGTNLSGIGKVMLHYASDYADKLPVAGGRDTTWGPRLNDWAAANRAEAFGLDPNGAGGQATVSSSLYLLVKYGNVGPTRFVCQGERGVRPFDPNTYRAEGRALPVPWDFGPDPAQHCSYSYHMPYSPHRLTTSGPGSTAVAADHNPWMDGARWKASNFARFRWDGSVKQQRAGNAVAHWLDGQNVLFLDSRVEFMKRSLCGLDKENIYTSWNGDDKSGGLPPRLGSVPTDGKDALLVNDPPARRKRKGQGRSL